MTATAPFTPPSFAEAHKAAAHILSAVSPHEAALLYRYALKCNEFNSILEIGSDKGFSTVLLAQTGRQVIAVDPHVAAEYRCEESGLSGAHGPEDYLQFAANTEGYDNITHIRKYSKDVGPLDGIVGFMFIDGNHAWPHPKDDFMFFYDYGEMVPGTFQAWHDYITFPGVTRAIEQLVKEGIIEFIEQSDSLAITRLI